MTQRQASLILLQPVAFKRLIVRRVTSAIR
jgi:hypothetical protein